MAEPAGVPSILYCGDLTPGSTSEMRCRALKELGYRLQAVQLWPTAPNWVTRKIMAIGHKVARPMDLVGANDSIVREGPSHDIVWIDKGVTIRGKTVMKLRRLKPGVKVLGYSPDNMAERACNSMHFLRCLPEYDAYLTTKSSGPRDLERLGARRAVFVPNAYDPDTHVPATGPGGEPLSKDIDIGFVGTYEKPRGDSILELCRSGLSVDVFGSGWRVLAKLAPRNLKLHPAVYGPAYAQTIARFRVALCFLRSSGAVLKQGDQQTTRSIELPACGAFMLAERTEEHSELFAEGIEAEFFGDDGELVEKCERYLADPISRARIAQAGRNRVTEHRYSYAWRLHDALIRLGIHPPQVPGEGCGRPDMRPNGTRQA